MKKIERGEGEKERILILDAENRSALAAIRALGREGYCVLAASHKKNAIGLVSKFVSKIHYYSDPAKEKDSFVKDILNLVNQHKPDLLLPCTDLSLELILSKENEFRSMTCLPFSKLETIKSILDKSNILKIANNCGIDIPKSSDEIDNIKNFPVVVKAKKSFNLANNVFSKPIVKYANNESELSAIVKSFNEPVMVQQKIVGPGIGVFTLSKNGKVLSYFCHQRLLEKPPTGGVSVLSESISDTEAPVEQSKRLIEHLKLDGIAMLEFKKHTDGKFYLMEINPRFWGSLQLAISAGRNFPVLLCKTFLDKIETIENKPYKIGLRLRWLLGSFDHLFIRIKSDGLLNVLSKNSLMLFQKQTCYDVFDTQDIKPFIRELKNYL